MTSTALLRITAAQDVRGILMKEALFGLTAFRYMRRRKGCSYLIYVCQGFINVLHIIHFHDMRVWH